MKRLIFDYAKKLLDERPFVRIVLDAYHKETLTFMSYYGDIIDTYRYENINVSSSDLDSYLSEQISNLNAISNSCLKYTISKEKNNGLPMVWTIFCAEPLKAKKLDLEHSSLEILKTQVSYPKSVDELYDDFRLYVNSRKETFISIDNYYICHGVYRYVTDNELVIGSEEVLFGERNAFLKGYAVSRNFIVSLPRENFDVYCLVNKYYAPQITGYYVFNKHYTLARK